MFSLAYVILPLSDASPADAIAQSLARFQRGGRGDVPDDWLQFHDDTAWVQELHRTEFTFTLDQGVRIEGGDSFDLDVSAIRQEMEARGKDKWTVRFVDVEPDFTLFTQRFLRPLDRHPVTDGVGQWLNPLGRWDWWDLGGRFNGLITGHPRGALRSSTTISSGMSQGRAVLEKLEDSIAATLDQQSPEPMDIVADDNTELIVTLAQELAAGNVGQLPSALVLPPGVLDDRDRWIANWPELGPEQALAAFGLTPDVAWRDVVQAAYSRFDNHWAAGVAFHH